MTILGKGCALALGNFFGGAGLLVAAFSTGGRGMFGVSVGYQGAVLSRRMGLGPVQMGWGRRAKSQQHVSRAFLAVLKYLGSFPSWYRHSGACTRWCRRLRSCPLHSRDVRAKTPNSGTCPGWARPTF